MLSQQLEKSVGRSEKRRRIEAQTSTIIDLEVGWNGTEETLGRTQARLAGKQLWPTENSWMQGQCGDNRDPRRGFYGTALAS